MTPCEPKAKFVRAVISLYPWVRAGPWFRRREASGGSGCCAGGREAASVVVRGFAGAGRSRRGSNIGSMRF